MASPQYTNADAGKQSGVFGGASAIDDNGNWHGADEGSFAPAQVSKYDGVSQPGDATFDWDHYEDYLKTHADPVAAAKQTLAATAPPATVAGTESTSAQPAPVDLGTVFGLKPNADLSNALSGVHDVGQNEALSMGPGSTVEDAMAALGPKIGPAVSTAGRTAAGAYGGYKVGGVPGAVAGAVAGYKAPGIASVIGKIPGLSGVAKLAEMLGLGAKAVPEGEAAGAGADIAGFDRYAPNTGGAHTPPASTEVPYASSQPVATPTTGWGRTTAGPGANPPSATPPSVEALFQDHPWGQSARNVPSGSDLATATQPQPDMTAWEALDQMRAPGRGDGMPPISSEAPSGPPSAGGATGAYPSGNTGEGAFSPDLSSIPTSSARGTADVAQGKAISASPAPQPSAPARVLYGPGATTQEGLPAQAGVGKGNSVLYDPQTPTAYLQAQYGLATDPAEKEFLARAIRQRSNMRNRTSSPWPPRQTTGQ